MRPGHRTHRWIVLVLLPLLAAACGDDPHLDATEYAVMVVDPGSIPGRELRYHWPEGKWHPLRIDVEVTATWSAGDRSGQPAPLPRASFPVQLQTVRKTEDLVVVGIRIGRPIPAIEGIEPYEGRIEFDARGTIRTFDLEVPGGTPPQAVPVFEGLIGRIARLFPPLPKEPIGVGARWKVALPIPGEPRQVEVRKCRLTLLRGDVTRIAIVLARESKDLPQEAAVGGDPAARHESGRAEGGATLALDLKSLSISGEEIVTAEDSYSIGEHEHHQVVSTKIRTRTVVSTR